MREGQWNGNLFFVYVPLNPLICQLLSLTIRPLVISCINEDEIHAASNNLCQMLKGIDGGAYCEVAMRIELGSSEICR